MFFSIKKLFLDKEYVMFEYIKNYSNFEDDLQGKKRRS